jgi:hypothetical protein
VKLVATLDSKSNPFWVPVQVREWANNKIHKKKTKRGVVSMAKTLVFNTENAGSSPAALGYYIGD